MLTEKLCGTCRVVKPVSEFYVRPGERSVRARCKPCFRDKAQENALLRKYGLTRAGYDILLEKQGGLCAICRGPQVYNTVKHGPRLLAVDHCHETGKIRGLLCNNCNRGLGLLGDSAEALEKVVEYLR